MTMAQKVPSLVLDYIHSDGTYNEYRSTSKVVMTHNEDYLTLLILMAHNRYHIRILMLMAPIK